MRLDNILVPLDGSVFAEHALPFAATLAERAEACLRLVTVAPLLVPMPGEDLPAHVREAHKRERARMHAYLENLEFRMRGPRHLRTSVHVLNGPPVDGIMAAIDDHDVDLVVMTSHGHGGFKRAWLGSVADQLIRRCDTPVLLLKPTSSAEPDLLAEIDYDSVVVSLDGSPFAEAALAPAIELAKLTGATVTLLDVIATPYQVLAGPVPYGVVDRELYAERRENADRYVHTVAERLRQEGIEARPVIVHDMPLVDTILANAQEGGALIAIATHGRGGFERMVIGSVADKVIRGAEGPVLAVRPREVAPASGAKVDIAASVPGAA